MLLSIIIPTYNRANTLKQCLEYLQKQSTRGFEVIVVDDGSTDETAQMVEDFNKKSWLEVRYFYQENKKQGAARNLGIKQAKGEIVFFLGDDIFALPNLVENHLAIHNAFPDQNIAVLGKTTWAPFLEINAYMRFLEWSGWQFHYGKIEQIPTYKNFPEYKEYDFKGKFLPPDKQHWFFYTSNLSVKKALLLKENFDENFQAYGWEDIELGLRLTQKADLHLFYNPEAETYHAHIQTEAEFEKKIITLASSLQYAPQLKPKPWKIFCAKILFSHFFHLFSQPFLSYNWNLWFRAKQIFYQNI